LGPTNTSPEGRNSCGRLRRKRKTRRYPGEGKVSRESLTRGGKFFAGGGVLREKEEAVRRWRARYRKTEFLRRADRRDEGEKRRVKGERVGTLDRRGEGATSGANSTLGLSVGPLRRGKKRGLRSRRLKCASSFNRGKRSSINVRQKEETRTGWTEESCRPSEREGKRSSSTYNLLKGTPSG